MIRHKENEVLQQKTRLLRDPTQTHKILLAAAQRVAATKGPELSLEAVAKEAGVSKGGLLHHFRSRDELLLAMTESWINKLEQSIHNCIDPQDTAPGHIARSYIRASFDATVYNGELTRAVVQATLMSSPGILEKIVVANKRWENHMASDGLHPQRVQIIARVLDGDANGMLLRTTVMQERNQLRDLLIALSLQKGPLVP